MTRSQAIAKAKRLAKANPDRTYCVYSIDEGRDFDARSFHAIAADHPYLNSAEFEAFDGQIEEEIDA